VKEFQADEEDPDRPIESYSGILGYTYDDFPLCIVDPILEPLNKIDWQEYARVAEFGDPRKLSLEIDNAEQQISISDDEVRLEEILDQTNFVDVYADCPGDQGPASGTLYSFFRKGSISEDFLKKGIRALVEACQEDFAMLKQRSNANTGA